MQQKTPVRIGITGSYGGMNLGDEGILHSMVTQLRNSLRAEITVFTRCCEDSLSRHPIDHAVKSVNMSLPEILPVIERLDALVVGGGGILYDAHARLHLREASLALEKGVPVMVYAVGAGPLKDSLVAGYVRDVLSAVDRLTVRDCHSCQILEEIGLRREMLITADPALLLKPETVDKTVLRREGLSGKGRRVGISVREAGVAAPDIQESHYHALLANAADFMIERFDADIIFIPMEPGVFDVQQAHAVISRMLRPQRASVLRGNYNSNQLLYIISHLDFAVGMRLHFLIFAARMGVPFVALPYSSKVMGFLEELDIEMPPINLVNEGRLMAYIDRAWDSREELKRKINTMLPRLQSRASENNGVLIDLLKQRKIQDKREQNASSEPS